MKLKHKQELTLEDLHKLAALGWKFRQKPLYAKGLPGEIEVFHLSAGWPVIATPPKKVNAD